MGMMGLGHNQVVGMSSIVFAQSPHLSPDDLAGVRIGHGSRVL